MDFRAWRSDRLPPADNRPGIANQSTGAVQGVADAKYIERTGSFIAATSLLFAGCNASSAQKKIYAVPSHWPDATNRRHVHPTDGCPVPSSLRVPVVTRLRSILADATRGALASRCRRPVTGSVAPAYYLVTILYAPPGTKSKASYFAGSSAGATTSTADLFGIGTKVGITGNVIATADYQFTQQSSEFFQATKTDKTELDTNSVADAIRHGQDAFYLWINPVINYTQEQSPGMPINISFGTAGGATMTVVQFTADELTHKESIPDYRSQYLKNFSDSDIAQILSADPWVASPGYSPDPNRLIKITSLQLDGPDNPGDNIPGQGTSVDDGHVNCQAETISQTIGADFGGAVGPTFFGQGEKATIVNSLSWKNTNSAGNCNGSSQTATVDLSTTTVDYHDVIDVYEDSLYHSFAYVSETQGVGLKLASAGVTGIVENSAGKPVANQLITVKFADGSTRKLFSNAQGAYRIFRVPPGPLAITSGGSVTRADFVPGQEIRKQLTVGNSILPHR